MIRTFSFSAAGGHPVNEDAFVLRPLPNGAGWIVALADGQGGRAGGALAAQLACWVVATRADAGAECLAEADATIAADPAAGLTTLVALCVEGDHVAGASCGDSAALVAWGDGFIRILTAHQFKNPPVGSGEAIFVPFEVQLTHPWRLLVMSDGVWKYAGWDRISNMAARLSGEELLSELQAAARLTTSGEFPDDFTVVLLESD